jgi:molybdate transport system permease protein
MSPDPFVSPVLVSLKVSLAALALAGPLGVALAFVQARRRYRLRAAVDALVLLPLVLPPSVVGYLLVVVFGRHGAVGQFLDAWWGLRLVFSPAAAVIAAAVVALPIVVKTAQPAIEAVPGDWEDTAATLGLAPAAVFARVTLPAAWRGIVAALVLGLARAVGEFGATLMFAGNTPGHTQTMPLAIWTAWQGGDDRRALFFVTLMTLFAVAVVVLAARSTPRLESSS